jgi:hypothetical protein
MIGTHDKGFITRFIALLQLLVDCKAPPAMAPFIASAPLIPLLKKNGDIRPIAIGETMRRIISKCALRSVITAATELLGPMQSGIGTPNAAFAEESARQRGTCALLVDFKNAFNSVSRITILNMVQHLQLGTVHLWMSRIPFH